MLSLGPDGEQPEPASSVKLTDEELAKIKAMHAKAAIVMHYVGNDWSQARIEGLKVQFAKMGIDVVATTDAGFKPDKQASDTETVLAQKPGIIVSIPTDPVATAAECRVAADARKPTTTTWSSRTATSARTSQSTWRGMAAAQQVVPGA